jgi:HTH-type transcriptional regulator/antitoxin HigA
MSEASERPQMPAAGAIAGEILGDELDARGWSHAEFAGRLALSEPWIRDIVMGRLRIGPRLAQQIGKQLRTSASLWENLQALDDKRGGAE